MIRIRKWKTEEPLFFRAYLGHLLIHTGLAGWPAGWLCCVCCRDLEEEKGDASQL
jgi:hypothetical protein